MPTQILARTERFERLVGQFYMYWSAFDFAVDFAIGYFLKTPPEVAHLMTAGMDFHRKARLLSALIKRSTHPKKAQLQGALRKGQNESKRNIFAHSFWYSSATAVTFVERTRQGDLTAIEHRYTEIQFKTHLAAFKAAALEFETSIAPRQELVDFAQALVPSLH